MHSQYSAACITDCTEAKGHAGGHYDCCAKPAQLWELSASLGAIIQTWRNILLPWEPVVRPGYASVGLELKINGHIPRAETISSASFPGQGRTQSQLYCHTAISSPPSCWFQEPLCLSESTEAKANIPVTHTEDSAEYEYTPQAASAEGRPARGN